MATSSKLSALANVCEKINKKSDSFTKVVTSFNQKLATLGFGIETWLTSLPVEEGDVHYDYEKDPNGMFPLHGETWLGYCKFDSGWALATKDVTLQEDGDETKTVEADRPVALLSASRELRMGAIRRIPELLDAMKNEADRMLAKLEQAETTIANL